MGLEVGSGLLYGCKLKYRIHQEPTEGDDEETDPHEIESRLGAKITQQNIRLKTRPPHPYCSHSDWQWFLVLTDVLPVRREWLEPGFHVDAESLLTVLQDVKQHEQQLREAAQQLDVNEPLDDIRVGLHTIHYYSE